MGRNHLDRLFGTAAVWRRVENKAARSLGALLEELLVEHLHMPEECQGYTDWKLTLASPRSIAGRPDNLLRAAVLVH